MKQLLTIRETERFQKRIEKGELILRSDLRDIEREAQYYEYLADKEASKPTPDGAYAKAWRTLAVQFAKMANDAKTL